MRFSMLVNFLPMASFLMVSGLCIAQADTTGKTIEGLQLVEDSNLATVYAEPGADLSRYDKIYLAEPYIAFRKNWKQTHSKGSPVAVDDHDMAKIKIELSSLFSDVFAGTLEEGGYELVTERAEDVLLIKPAIVNLDIVAPGAISSNNTHTYSETAGEMTLYLELYDSLTDDIIAKAVDRQTARQTGYIQWQNRVENRAAARRILQVWADVLKEGLDDASRNRQ